MILVIDNYDSFTYNLVQYLGELTSDIKVYRNDSLTLDELRELHPERIVISPGPGRPERAGISVAVIQQLAGEIPILGVCLGEQSIGYAFGGKIVPARKLMHGKTSLIAHHQQELFAGVNNPFEATRYHSLAVDRQSLPECLEVTAWTQDEDQEIMGLRHKTLPVWGVQFHPESILTTEGKKILGNFLKL